MLKEDKKEYRVTDANIYWIPEELFTDEKFFHAFLRTVPQEYGVRAVGYVLDDGRKAIKIEKPEGYDNLNYFQGDYVLEHQLKEMDEACVDKAVMKLPGCQEWMNLDLCRKFNDLSAQFSERTGGRMVPLAVVPPYGDQESLDELDRCINELHMHGVQVSAHYGTKYLDDPMFRTFFKHVNDLNIPVYVHHTPLPVDHQSLIDYNNLRRSFGRCQDQVTAVSREIFSGMFDELPNLKMVHSMLGGAYYAFVTMFFPTDSGGGRFQAGRTDIKEQFREHIYFELSHSQPWGKENLELAVRLLGADHMIYGSSYPVKKIWLTGGPWFVADLDISEKEKELILSGTAEKIYHL